MPNVVALKRFPVKGMKGRVSPMLAIDPAVGVVGDRCMAYARNADQSNKWALKSAFYVGANLPAMVSLDPYTTAPDVLRSAGIENPQLLESHGDFNFTDTQGPTVSLLNVDTAREFSTFVTGEPYKLDNDRYRMNVMVGGLAILEELSWVKEHPGTRKLWIGNVRFRIDDACERCAAIQANPVTGVRDYNLNGELIAFMNHYVPEYRSPKRKVQQVMGVILVPETAGVIYVGDKLRLE